MRITSFRVGLILAALNVLVFIVMLVTRETDYARLDELDACYRGGSSCDYSSAEPIYLAGRPFYSSMHVGGVPWTEDAFFAANLPAMLATLVVERFWLAADNLSLTEQSWIMATSFMTLAALWAFLVGAAGHRLVRLVRTRNRTPST
jgi:hypothetical protein